MTEGKLKIAIVSMLYGSFVSNLFIMQWLWRWGLRRRWRWRLRRVSALRKLVSPHQCLQHFKCSKYLVSSDLCSHIIHTCFLCSTEEEDVEVGGNTPLMTLYLEMPKFESVLFNLFRNDRKLNKMCTLEYLSKLLYKILN